jgi:hypothetical protein
MLRNATAVRSVPSPKKRTIATVPLLLKDWTGIVSARSALSISIGVLELDKSLKVVSVPSSLTTVKVMAVELMESTVPTKAWTTC